MPHSKAKLNFINKNISYIALSWGLLQENYRPTGRQSKPVIPDYKARIPSISSNTLQLAISGISRVCLYWLCNVDNFPGVPLFLCFH